MLAPVCPISTDFGRDDLSEYTCRSISANLIQTVPNVTGAKDALTQKPPVSNDNEERSETKNSPQHYIQDAVELKDQIALSEESQPLEEKVPNEAVVIAQSTGSPTSPSVSDDEILPEDTLGSVQELEMDGPKSITMDDNVDTETQETKSEEEMQEKSPSTDIPEHVDNQSEETPQELRETTYARQHSKLAEMQAFSHFLDPSAQPFFRPFNPEAQPFVPSYLRKKEVDPSSYLGTTMNFLPSMNPSPTVKQERSPPKKRRGATKGAAREQYCGIYGQYKSATQHFLNWVQATVPDFTHSTISKIWKAIVTIVKSKINVPLHVITALSTSISLREEICQKFYDGEDDPQHAHFLSLLKEAKPLLVQLLDSGLPENYPAKNSNVPKKTGSRQRKRKRKRRQIKQKQEPEQSLGTKNLFDMLEPEQPKEKKQKQRQDLSEKKVTLPTEEVSARFENLTDSVDWILNDKDVSSRASWLFLDLIEMVDKTKEIWKRYRDKEISLFVATATTNAVVRNIQSLVCEFQLDFPLVDVMDDLRIVQLLRPRVNNIRRLFPDIDCSEVLPFVNDPSRIFCMADKYTFLKEKVDKLTQMTAEKNGGKAIDDWNFERQEQISEFGANMQTISRVVWTSLDHFVDPDKEKQKALPFIVQAIFFLFCDNIFGDLQLWKEEEVLRRSVHPFRSLILDEYCGRRPLALPIALHIMISSMAILGNECKNVQVKTKLSLGKFKQQIDDLKPALSDMALQDVNEFMNFIVRALPDEDCYSWQMVPFNNPWMAGQLLMFTYYFLNNQIAEVWDNSHELTYLHVYKALLREGFIEEPVPFLEMMVKAFKPVWDTPAEKTEKKCGSYKNSFFLADKKRRKVHFQARDCNTSTKRIYLLDFSDINTDDGLDSILNSIEQALNDDPMIGFNNAAICAVFRSATYNLLEALDLIGRAKRAAITTAAGDLEVGAGVLLIDLLYTMDHLYCSPVGQLEKKQQLSLAGKSIVDYWDRISVDKLKFLFV